MTIDELEMGKLIQKVDGLAHSFVELKDEMGKDRKILNDVKATVDSWAAKGGLALALLTALGAGLGFIVDKAIAKIWP